MDISLALSILALLLSALSALYARWAVSEAKQANRISGHSHKLAILENARNFCGGFRIDGEALASTYFDSLLESSGKASLYFSKPVADHLAKYADAALAVLIARDGLNRIKSTNGDVPSEKWEEVFRLVDACRAMEGSLLADLEAQTRVVG